MLIVVIKYLKLLFHLDALTDLFINYLLPNRALKNFEEVIALTASLI